MRLALGEALEDLASTEGHHTLGFSSLGAYVRERCERPVRWAGEGRVVARRLKKLPQMRAEVLAGRMSWSMAELLSRYAMPEHEAQLIAKADQCTVRQMREWVRAEKEHAGEEAQEAIEEVSERPITMTRTVDTEEAWAFECTRMLLEHIESRKLSTDEVLECMLAEAMGTLLDAAPLGTNPFEIQEQDTDQRKAWLEQLKQWREQAEKMCESRFVNCESDKEKALGFVPEKLPDAVVGKDAVIRRLAAQIARRDLAIGRCACRLFDANGWRKMGYATETQYARERVGMSYSALKKRMTLWRRVNRLPMLKEALQRGEIGIEAGGLVARVASGKTVEAWIARAKQRTVKHLYEEVEAVELLGRMLALGRDELEPPEQEIMQEVQRLESKVVSGAILRRYAETGQGNGQEVASNATASERLSQISAGGKEEDTEASDDISQISVYEENGGRRKNRDSGAKLRPGAGRVTFQWRISEETYRFWQEVEHAHQRSMHNEMRFLQFLCACVWRSWYPSLRNTVKYHEIYERDRYRCTSPVCSKRDVTPHHVRFRAHGGDDSPDNVTTLCVWCHLEGVHGGRIRVSAPVSDMRFVVGKNPILEVQGRERIGSATVESV
jgi:hypothetical protein